LGGANDPGIGEIQMRSPALMMGYFQRA
jgi:long-subunit acyl-CoA synthetase (AMP-forming)